MKSVTQYREDLDEQGCCDCGCGDYEILQRCHPDAGVTANYARGTGRVVIRCRECRALVVAIPAERKNAARPR